MDAPLLINERIDDLGRRGYRIIQNRTRFCFGVDAVLLSWFADVRKGERVVDLCSGTGIVPLLMDARYGAGDYTGLEILPDLADMANRSAMLNDVETHVRFIRGDVKDAAELLGKGQFQAVTVNPPYMPAGSGLRNPDREMAIARHEILCTLEDVVRAAKSLLETGGRFYMVHRPGRLPEILSVMEAYRIAPERAVFVHPFADKDAAMVLISGISGGRNRMRTEAPLILYEAPGKYTEQVLKIYREDG